jgi:LemA protein
MIGRTPVSYTHDVPDRKRKFLERFFQEAVSFRGGCAHEPRPAFVLVFPAGCVLPQRARARNAALGVDITHRLLLICSGDGARTEVRNSGRFTRTEGCVMGPVLLVLAILVGLIILWFVLTYNGLIGMRNRVRNAWSQIDVQLRRRYDLIPNLVETAKGYMKHEREVLENVTKARQQGIDATTVKEQAAAENTITAALRQLFAVVENYPDLKANQNMLALQEELTSTENKISFARQFYNDSVMKYNTRIQRVPAKLVADMCNFKEEDFFEIEEGEAREPVKVKF